MSQPDQSQQAVRGAPDADLYAVLGVRRDANADTIRRAYYRKAMYTHPDRAGSDATGAFQQVQKAYEVLSDPVKRRAYDMHGDDGLRMLEGDTTPLMQSMGIKAVLSFSSFGVAFAVCCVLAQLIVITVQVDAEKEWRWVNVLAPTWVFDAATVATLLAVVVITLRNACVDEDFSRIQFKHALAAAGILLGVTSHVLIGVALETEAFGALIAVAPALLASLVLAVALTPESADRKRMKDMLHINTGVEPSAFVVVWAVITNVTSLFAFPIALLLAGLRVDGHMGDGVHYFIIAAPYCIIAFFSTVGQWLMTGLLMQANQATMGQRVCSLIMEILRHGTVIAGAVLVSIKLQTRGAEPDLLAFCFIPWFALLLYGGCGLCFMGFLLADGANDDLTTLEQLQRQEEEMQRHEAHANAMHPDV
jgi:hypothetical protein